MFRYRNGNWYRKVCEMLVMDKGKIAKSVGIELPDGKAIKSLQEGES